MEYRHVLDTMKKYPHALHGHGHCSCDKDQLHDHEFLGSTKLAETGQDKHNHRFAGVTGEAIPIGNGRHIHEFCSHTDFFENHFHMIMGKTGPDIDVPDGKHVHFAEGCTTVSDGHKHGFHFATLIDDPLH